MWTKILGELGKPRIKYDPLVKIFIYRKSLLHNFEVIKKSFPNLGIAPVLKSNAYGHGLVEVAKILEAEKPPFFVVDSFFEALVLRRAMVKTKILIVGYTREELMTRKTLKNASFTIISLESLRYLAAHLKKEQLFHLKIDTGMHRQGILFADIPEAIKLLKSNPKIVLEGLCSHLADADNPDETFTKQQIAIWNQAVQMCRKEFPEISYFHAVATSGLRFVRETDANVARVGIGLFGIDPVPESLLELRPVLEMRSVVSSIKTIPTGEKIGYGVTFESKQPLTIANVPAGYNEGIDWRLSNKGQFLVKGQACSILGRVSMNITTINVTQVSGLSLQDEVIIISRDKNASNSVENIARICHTIPYEILVHIPAHLRRVVV